MIVLDPLTSFYKQKYSANIHRGKKVTCLERRGSECVWVKCPFKERTLGKVSEQGTLLHHALVFFVFAPAGDHVQYFQGYYSSRLIVAVWIRDSTEFSFFFTHMLSLSLFSSMPH